MPILNCKQCGIEFHGQKTITKFCSSKCWGIHQSKQFGYPDVNRNCEYCNQAFLVAKPSRKQRFCSKQCAFLSLKNKNDNRKQQLVPAIKEYRKNHSAEETGKQFGMSTSGIRQWGIVGPETEKRQLCPNEFTQEQYEIFVGNMLGDGCLTFIQTGTNRNSHFAIGQKNSSSEYVKALYDIYLPFSCGYYDKKSRKPSTVNGKINHDEENWDGEYLHASTMYTICHPIFTQYRMKWYKDPYQKKSQKIVPQDIKLTWKTAAIWMCDDGSNHSKSTASNKYGQRYLMLHTECFLDSDVEFLLTRLKEDLKIIGALNRHRGKPTIRIGGDESYAFIDSIKQYIPWKCFQYKCINRQKINRNKSGFVGVLQVGRKWKAFKSFRINGEFMNVNIGMFDNPEDAHLARENWILENQNFRENMQ